MKALKKLDIKKFDGSEFIDFKDEVIDEVSVSLLINNEREIILNCSPINLEELVMGHLYTTGQILNKDDVMSLDIKDSEIGPKAYVQLKNSVSGLKQTGTTSGMIVSKPFYGMNYMQPELELDIKSILNLTNIFTEEDTLFRRTGGTHSVALIKNNEIIAIYEDIGRHNALDKVIGHAILNDLDLSTSILLLSGRIASEMLIKAMRAGVSTVISKSAPTTMSVKLSKENNVTVIGFLRNGKFNLYNLSSNHIFK